MTTDAPSVTLNCSADLTLLDVQLRVGGQVVQSTHDLNAGFEQLTIRPKEGLRTGDVVEVGIAFESPLNGSMRGYYKSPGGKQGTYSLTQFGPSELGYSC